ncbi:hypothetical protein B0O80DRAFT_474654 [Mortierella sp. GBAus27b]|nr:hypothetical protein BGX31_000240 [Mortierella sp. GBA43]KAI8345229.1 hypothetical protein B0O80DRAFT_474654 [Mortierella sp. GBAus27b]
MSPQKSSILFDLPELCGPISRHLEPQDLARCTQVCRDWHANFTPCLWHTLKLHDGNQPAPSIAITSKYCHLVKSLSFHGVFDKEHASLRFSNATTLYLGHGRDAPSTLFQSVPQLVTLKLVHIRPQDPDTFWNQISGIQTLRRLELSGIYLEQKHQLKLLWTTCTRLESLYISQGQVNPEMAKEMEFPFMRSLSVLNVQGMATQDVLAWFVKCPNLRELYWLRSFSTTQDTSSLPSKGAWPFLDVLDLGDKYFSDDNLANILRNMSNQPRDLRVPHCEFGGLSFEVLKSRFGGLTRLDLPNLSKKEGPVTGKMVHEILCSNPQLRVLNACRVKALDFLDDKRPWVCGNTLRSLTIYFEFPRDDNDISDFQKAIFKRLSTLTSLEALDVSGRFRMESSADDDGLDFRLKSGLGELSTLKQIRRVIFERTRQRMGNDEALWMSKQWPNLQSLRGVWNEDPATLRRLRGILLK